MGEFWTKRQILSLGLLASLAGTAAMATGAPPTLRGSRAASACMPASQDGGCTAQGFKLI
jgi:hypothetical protein